MMRANVLRDHDIGGQVLPRPPVSLLQIRATPGEGLARLSGLEGFARAVVSGVIPVIALQALGTKQAVSLTFLVGGALALAVTLSLGTIERLLQRRWAMTLGMALLVTAAGLNLVDGPAFALGIGFRAAAASVFSVLLSLFIMDFISRRSLTRNESRRMVYVGTAWLIGPSLGLWLAANYGRGAPLALSAAAATLAIAYFWRLRMGSDPVLMAPASTAVNPLAAIPRYFEQRYLRIAYAITTCRSMFWVAIFIYGPIYVADAGLPVWVSGVMLSAVSGFLWLSPLVRIGAERFGTRRVIVAGFVVLATALFGLAALGDERVEGVALWVIAALGASALDVVGNIPFMRTVRPRERVPMTAVFSTWREVSTLLTPATAATVLVVAPFEVFYLILAGLASATAWAATYLPRRL